MQTVEKSAIAALMECAKAATSGIYSGAEIDRLRMAVRDMEASKGEGPQENRITIEIDSSRVQEEIDKVIGALKSRLGVFGEVIDERKRQDGQWGGPAHDDTRSKTDWQNYIHRQSYAASAFAATPEQHRERLIKIAALAVAAIESIDRKAGKPCTQ